MKELSIAELEQLSGELNSVIVDTVSRNGGHLASSLGAVDLTVALHRVFDSPKDKILWDVGHQTYAHKLLTGRKEKFASLRQYGGLSGFCQPAESEHDAFISGHAGSAVSAAMAYAAAGQLNHAEGHVVAVVGDGSLINGVTLEALNNLRTSCKRMILVLNDNAMSIDKSIGALPRSLNRLITGRSYNRFKAFAKLLLHRFPGGSTVVHGIRQLESAAKNLFVPGIFFEELGIRYVGPVNGHDMPELIRTFESVKEWNRPLLVHVVTEKGHGFGYAEKAPEKFHGVGAFDPATGKSFSSASGGDTFSAAFGRTLEETAEQNRDIVAITAAMGSGCGIPESFIQRHHDRFFDVGIAEEHALVFAGGLAAAGKRPVVAMYATFLQRGLDCVFHDICLQSLPVLICIDRAGVVEDGPTHHGLYDLSFLLAMPNLAVLMPESEDALAMMMKAALAKNDIPVAIRYPRGGSGVKETPAPLEWGCAVCDQPGTDLAIWSAGRELYTARKVREILQTQYGIRAAVWNTRFLKPFDKTAFLACAKKMPVATLEDNSLRGGLADIAAAALAELPERKYPFFRYGWTEENIVPHGKTNDLRTAAGLMPEQIAADLAAKLKA